MDNVDFARASDRVALPADEEKQIERFNRFNGNDVLRNARNGEEKTTEDPK